MVSTGILVSDEATVTPLVTERVLRTGASSVICALRSVSAAAVGASSRQSVSLNVGANRWQKYWMPAAPWTRAIQISVLIWAGVGRLVSLMFDPSMSAMTGLVKPDHWRRLSTPLGTASRPMPSLTG